MIRIHQVWPELELEGCHKFVEDYFQDNVFDNVEWTLEHSSTPVEESDRLRSSANYILFFVNNYGMSLSSGVDLTYNLATRPKRVVMVITHPDHDPGDYIQQAVRNMLSQFSRLFPAAGYQVINNLVDLKTWLESLNPTRTIETTT